MSNTVTTAEEPTGAKSAAIRFASADGRDPLAFELWPGNGEPAGEGRPEDAGDDVRAAPAGAGPVRGTGHRHDAGSLRDGGAAAPPAERQRLRRRRRG